MKYNVHLLSYDTHNYYFDYYYNWVYCDMNPSPVIVPTVYFTIRFAD